MKYLVEEKYNFLLSKLKPTNIDYWEQDGLLCIPADFYFQFEQDHGLLLDLSLERKDQIIMETMDLERNK